MTAQFNTDQQWVKSKSVQIIVINYKINLTIKQIVPYQHCTSIIAGFNLFIPKITFNLVILLTVCHRILIMLVLRIWYWINSQVPGEELKVTSDELLYSLSKFSYIPFRNRGRSKCWNSNSKSLRALFWKTISCFFLLMYFGFSSVWKKVSLTTTDLFNDVISI